MAYSLPELNYAYDALEPHIDAKTMEIHHTKHHQAYIDKANKALEGHNDLSGQPIEQLIAELVQVPDAIRGAIRNNGGGHANHSLFWKILTPGGSSKPVGKLAEVMNATFGSFEDFQEQFSNAGATRFGSGWAWLIVKEDRKLAVTSTPNQDSPLMKGAVEQPGTPIIGLDVWEHAYYLNYQNRRPDYIKAFFNVINWDVAEELYQEAIK